MARIRPLIFWLVLPAFGLYEIWSGGGLHIYNKHDFDGQRGITLIQGLESDVWLSPKWKAFFVPLLFQYGRSGEPFDLRLQIWDSSKQYRSIEVTEVLVEYKDGQVVRKSDPWIKKLRPYTEYHSSSSGVSQTEMLMLSEEIPNLVLRHVDVKVTLSGHLTTVDGKRVAFRASEDFEAESDLRTATWWEVISSC
jgi:hypothetical protein